MHDQDMLIRMTTTLNIDDELLEALVSLEITHKLARQRWYRAKAAPATLSCEANVGCIKLYQENSEY